MRRASRPPRSRQPAPAVITVADMLGLLIETTGTEVGREVRAIISDLVAHDHEFAREMMRLVQAMRDTGALEQNEAWHLLYWTLERMSDQWSETGAELVRLTAAMEAIEQSHGFSEDEYFHLDDAPADFLALSGEWDRRLNVIWAGELTTLGESEMARLVITDELHEDPRLADGRASLFRGGSTGDHVNSATVPSFEIQR